MKPKKQNSGMVGVFESKAFRDQKYAPRISSIVVFTLSAFVAGAIAIASNTTVPELARASGEITTQGHGHKVESINAGIVESVLVKEGQLVVRNQVLASLVSPEVDREISALKQQLAAVSSQIHIHSSILEHLDQAPQQTPEAPQLVGPATDYARSRVYLHDLQKEIAQNRANSLAEIILELENAQALMSNRVAEKETSVERLRGLFQSGSITRIRLEAEEQSLDELRGRLIDAGIELATNKANYSETRDEPMKADLALREKTLTEMFALQQQKDMLLVRVSTLNLQKDDLLIRAPASGIIQAVDFPRAGEVIEAGSALFELINTDEKLVAQIRVAETDIGHIHEGDHVSLKLTTFDSRRYGEITGQIASLSPNIVVDPSNGQSYFRGIVALDQLTIGTGELEKPVRVGMSVSAEIVTDERSMLAYLAKPVHRSLERAFGER